MCGDSVGDCCAGLYPKIDANVERVAGVLQVTLPACCYNRICRVGRVSCDSGCRCLADHNGETECLAIGYVCSIEARDLVSLVSP